MSKYNRNFSRRIITWKITDLTRESIRMRKWSPQFSILLGDNETKWHLEIGDVDHYLELYLCYNDWERNFSIDFSTQLTIASNQGKKLIGEFKKLSGKDHILIPLHVLFDEHNKFYVGKELKLEMKIELIEDPKFKMLENNYILDNYETNVNNKQLSDFVFICSDNEKVHVQKGIIAAQCEAFEAMIRANMTEAKTNSATITDVDSETMLELVRFLYCGRVKKMKNVQERLVIAANKYGIENLKNLCVSSLMESLTVENVHNIFEIANLLGEKHLKENCIDFIKCHQSRFECHLNEPDFSKELLWAVWKSLDSKSIRINFKNEEMLFNYEENF